eukprot:2100063-Prymnesium_polylepis.2
MGELSWHYPRITTKEHDCQRGSGVWCGLTVEDVLLLGEVDPVDAVQLLGQVGALDTHADDVGRLVLEARVVGRAIVALGQLGQLRVVGRHAQQLRQRHRREKAVERQPRAVLQHDGLGAQLGAHARHARAEPLALLWQRFEDLWTGHGRGVRTEVRAAGKGANGQG